MCRARLAAGLIAAALVVPAAARDAIEGAALADALASGRLAGVSVRGTVDLATLAPETGPLVFEGVSFEGDVIGPPSVPLLVKDSRFAALRSHPDRAWAAEVRFETVEFSGPVELAGATLTAAFTCVACTFGNGARFDGVVAEAPVRITASTFAHDWHASFKRARFAAPTSFAHTDFGSRALFQGSTFAADASFVAARAGAAYFIGTVFHGDAEFRSCEFGDARFGVPRPAGARPAAGPRSIDAVTDFGGFADFRRCAFQEATFDDANFRARASFRGARIGKGGLGLRTATADGAPLDLRTIDIEGPLVLTGALLPLLELDLRAMLPALSRAAASPAVYHALARRLRENGEPLDALRAEYEARRLEWSESSLGEGPARDRLTASAEWLLWTWPTRNGTSLDRLVLVSLGLWLAGGVPLLLWRRRLVVVPPAARGRGDAGRGEPWQPLAIPELPPGSYSVPAFLPSCAVAYTYAFRLMFKLSSRRIRHVSIPDRPFAHALGRYALALWLGGALLLAVAVLTLANLSPSLRTILPIG